MFATESNTANQMNALDADWTKQTDQIDKQARSLGDAKNLQNAFMRYFASQIGVGPDAAAGTGVAITAAGPAPLTRGGAKGGRGRGRKPR